MAEIINLYDVIRWIEDNPVFLYSKKLDDTVPIKEAPEWKDQVKAWRWKDQIGR